MTKEHLGITIALKIPFFIVLTKVDICPENIFKELMDKLRKVLRGPQVNKIPIEIREGHDIAELDTIAK